MTAARTVLAVACAAVLAACGRGEGDDYVRGHGLQPAGLPPAAEASVYESALGAAFDLGPGLVLLLDPQLLPRTAGVDGGDAVPRALAAVLRQRGIVQGTCQPPRGAKAVPVCKASAAGYVVRFSPVLRLGGDSVEVYLRAEQYRTSPNQPAQALRFEKAYQIVGSDGQWRVAREARIP